MLIRFGNCELDSERRELRRDATLVHVQPQVFDLLTYLITHRDCVVSRDEMVEAIWEGRSVSDVTLNSRINAARAMTENGRRSFGRFRGEAFDLLASSSTESRLPVFLPRQQTAKYHSKQARGRSHQARTSHFVILRMESASR